MSVRFDCGEMDQRSAGLAEAAAAVGDGKLVVFPTDTIYGVGADAFSPGAVSTLLTVRNGTREMPPSVLVGSVRAAAALTESLGAFGQDLIDEFWPGPLTLVFRSSPTLMWDLGDTRGTVAVRMPLHPVALDLLRRTGPMAVSGASLHGSAAATSADAAMDQFGESVSVYLDGGTCAESVTSTILDLTGTVPRMLRAGGITVDDLRKVVPVVDLPVPADTPPESPADRRAREAIEAANAVVPPAEPDPQAPDPAQGD